MEVCKGRKTELLAVNRPENKKRPEFRIEENPKNGDRQVTRGSKPKLFA